MYWTEAYILKKSDFLEHDRLLDVFSRDWGRIEIVARGTRKINSKLNPHLNLLDRIKIGIVRGSSRWVLVDAQTNDFFESGSAENYRLGFKVLDIAGRLLYYDLPEEKIFDLMSEILSLLRGNHLSQNRQAPYVFWAKCLNDLGYQPTLDIIKEAEKQFLIEPQSLKNIFLEREIRPFPENSYLRLENFLTQYTKQVMPEI